ncbi:MAG: 5,6-dimethylbenzimidazole synthase [Cohaesibacter sp.]|jgi:5,6-dimethylbenzimidazole synthase|nr:5,6-dimethylbenzimidazole synthase [Cohaesibacter sp.]
MRFDPQDAQTLFKIMQWRRDVRHFDTTPLTEEDLDTLKMAFDLAPSVGNARPWRVIRVQSPDLRAKVRDEFERCNSDAATSYALTERSDYLKLKLQGLDQAPEQFCIFTATDPAEGRRLGRRTMPETLRQSTAMALHGLWLIARARNIGMGMVSILDPKRVESIFDCPPEWEFSAYLCLGYPQFTDDTPLLHRTGWQENTQARWEER